MFVLVEIDILDVDNVLTPAGSPVKVHLSSALGSVLQDLEGALLASLDLSTTQHLPADAKTQNIGTAIKVFMAFCKQQTVYLATYGHSLSLQHKHWPSDRVVPT